MFAETTNGHHHQVVSTHSHTGLKALQYTTLPPRNGANSTLTHPLPHRPCSALARRIPALVRKNEVLRIPLRSRIPLGVSLESHPPSPLSGTTVCSEFAIGKNCRRRFW